MKASVFTDGGVPTVVDEANSISRLGGNIEELHVVSEWSLKVAVHALQAINRTATCGSARRMSKDALEAIALAGDLPCDDKGVPLSPRFGRNERPGSLNLIGNPFMLWE